MKENLLPLVRGMEEQGYMPYSCVFENVVEPHLIMRGGNVLIQPSLEYTAEDGSRRQLSLEERAERRSEARDYLVGLLRREGNLGLHIVPSKVEISFSPDSFSGRHGFCILHLDLRSKQATYTPPFLEMDRLAYTTATNILENQGWEVEEEPVLAV